MLPTRSSLSANRCRLVDTCSHVGFGRIERLLILGGEPRFDPPTLIITEHKFGADQAAVERAADFILKPTVLDLLRVLDRVGDGSIRCLEIRHGLPFRAEIEGVLAA